MLDAQAQVIDPSLVVGSKVTVLSLKTVLVEFLIVTVITPSAPTDVDKTSVPLMLVATGNPASVFVVGKAPVEVKVSATANFAAAATLKASVTFALLV